MSAVAATDASRGVGLHRQVVIDAVTHRYAAKGAKVLALQDVNLTIDPGEFVCLAGPSGCGKTTLLQLVGGFITPSEGRITLGGAEVKKPGAERGVVFQQPNLYPWMSVRKNVELGPMLRKVPKAQREAQAAKYLRMVGLDDFSERRPYELSGGMQQRAQIARVLTNDPDIILMDEPFGALDALTRERLQVELLTIWRETRKTIFFITHSVEEAIFLGSRVLVMSTRPGRIVYDERVNFLSAMDADMPVGQMRSLPAFIKMRDEVSKRIYESGG